MITLQMGINRVVFVNEKRFIFYKVRSIFLKCSDDFHTLRVKLSSGVAQCLFFKNKQKISETKFVSFLR
jgi:hypothetical protein